MTGAAAPRGRVRLTKYQVLIHAGMIALCVVTLYPFLTILSASFQDATDLRINGYSLIPRVVNLDAYRMMLANPAQLIDSYAVTLYTTAVSAVVGLWVTAAFAYALSRKDYGLRRALAFYVFFTMLFSGGLVPTYIMMVKMLKLKNTAFALILPMLVNAWYILMMKGFMDTLGMSLVESAKIDGAGELMIFVRIILPMSTPGLATIGLFLVLNNWNEWFLSMLYIDKDNLIKLQYLLVRLMRSIEFLNSKEAFQAGAVKEGMVVPTEGARMAMCVLAAGPMLLIFPFFQRYFVRGIAVGSLKG